MIHHSTKKKAESLGVIMTELQTESNDKGADFSSTPQFPGSALPPNTVQAFWPKHNVYAFGAGDKPGTAALNEMEALIEIKVKMPDAVIINDVNDPFLVRVFLTNSREQVLDRDGSTPTDALRMINDGKHVWSPTTVPLDGGAAHKAGFPITDNPYSEEDDGEDFARWDEQWETSADEADADDGKDEPGGSVVKQEYRIRYAEAGHPNHCGDWLALICTALSLDEFEALCNANGVNLDKYNRENPGWQGRLKMTGRNLLARKVYLAEGKLTLTENMAKAQETPTLTAPADWMAAQKFRMPKKELAVAEKAAAAKK